MLSGKNSFKKQFLPSKLLLTFLKWSLMWLCITDAASGALSSSLQGRKKKILVFTCKLEQDMVQCVGQQEAMELLHVETTCWSACSFILERQPSHQEEQSFLPWSYSSKTVGVHRREQHHFHAIKSYFLPCSLCITVKTHLCGKLRESLDPLQML